MIPACHKSPLGPSLLPALIDSHVTGSRCSSAKPMPKWNSGPGTLMNMQSMQYNIPEIEVVITISTDPQFCSLHSLQPSCVQRGLNASLHGGCARPNPKWRPSMCVDEATDTTFATSSSCSPSDLPLTVGYLSKSYPQ